MVASNDPPQKNRRRSLKLARKILWAKLRSRRLGGYRFKRQTSIDNYIDDFYYFEIYECGIERFNRRCINKYQSAVRETGDAHSTYPHPTLTLPSPFRCLTFSNQNTYSTAEGRGLPYQIYRRQFWDVTNLFANKIVTKVATTNV